MRPEIFEALAPLCPRCLHTDGIEAPLVIHDRTEDRTGLIWHGMIHCSRSECWQEFPILDGIPVLVPDPRTYLNNSRHHVLLRDDLPEMLTGMIGDALGPGSELDTTRQHLSLYAGTHFADWTAEGGAAQVPTILDTGWSALPDAPEGPAIDLGTSVGRGVWELAARRAGLVIGADLNFSMLRLGQRLLLEGRATFPQRRIGMVFDPVEVTLPADMVSDRVDLWAMDCMALPFRPGQFAMATALNLVDCIPGPTDMIVEAARVLAPGAAALFTTPFDWSAAATDPAGWMGGHSQRGATGGDGEAVLSATLANYGLTPVAEAHDVPWQLRVHARSVMQYRLHMVVCQRAVV